MSPAVTSPDGTAVSRFAFGCMQFGGGADLQASARMFGAAIDAGITHFDTAHLYTDGASEKILGALVAPMRDRLSIATKIGYRGANPARLRAEFELSRRRLDMDQVDLLYLHKFDPNVPLHAQLEVLAEFADHGWARAFGLSNYAAWQVMKAQDLFQTMGHGIAAIQPMYSLVKRMAEVELLPMAQDQGLTTFGYSPLGSGLLTGKYVEAGTQGRLATDSRYAARYAPPAMQEAARGLTALAQEVGAHPATLAAAWAARHPAAPIPLLSARNWDQLQPSLLATEFTLDDALYARISALYPAPPPATDRIEEAPAG